MTRKSPPHTISIVIALLVITTALTFGWYSFERWKVGQDADKTTDIYMEDFTPRDVSNRSSVTLYRTTYHSIQVDHAISDHQLQGVLDLVVGPNHEADEMRCFLTGLLIDSSHAPTNYITRRQMVTIAETCKPLLNDQNAALRECECIFLYRSELPEAETDILALTNDPVLPVSQHAMRLVKKIEQSRSAVNNGNK